MVTFSSGVTGTTASSSTAFLTAQRARDADLVVGATVDYYCNPVDGAWALCEGGYCSSLETITE